MVPLWHDFFGPVTVIADEHRWWKVSGLDPVLQRSLGNGQEFAGDVLFECAGYGGRG